LCNVDKLQLLIKLSTKNAIFEQVLCKIGKFTL